MMAKGKMFGSNNDKLFNNLSTLDTRLVDKFNVQEAAKQL